MTGQQRLSWIAWKAILRVYQSSVHGSAILQNWWVILNAPGVLSAWLGSYFIWKHAYALDLKNQLTTANMDEHVSHLAERSTYDTTAVKWITFLTLIYLPGSFVAVSWIPLRRFESNFLLKRIRAKTLYGMNFFLFNPQTRRIEVSKNFWLYMVTWIPLTLVTLIGYLLMRSFYKAKRNDSDSREAFLSRSKEWMVVGGYSPYRSVCHWVA